jgi:hypothetical protein
MGMSSQPPQTSRRPPEQRSRPRPNDNDGASLSCQRQRCSIVVATEARAGRVRASWPGCAGRMRHEGKPRLARDQKSRLAGPEPTARQPQWRHSHPKCPTVPSRKRAGSKRSWKFQARRKLWWTMIPQIFRLARIFRGNSVFLGLASEIAVEDGVNEASEAPGRWRAGQDGRGRQRPPRRVLSGRVPFARTSGARDK